MVNFRCRAVALIWIAAPWTAVGEPLAAQQAGSTQGADTFHIRGIEVSITGRGATRGLAALDTLLLVRAVPSGQSPLRTIERLPGVNVNSADAFGAYEWSTRVTIRGFQSQQIGQTFDGLPLGDMSYGNFNGLNIARAVDPANLAATTVEQGAGALGTASANNLGGVVAYRSAEASNTPGIRFQQLAGSYNAFRTHVRTDLGMRRFGSSGRDGVRGYVSFQRTDNDKWKGGGERHSSFPGNAAWFFGQDGVFRESENWQDQLNLKADAFFGDSKITGYFNYSDKKESDYMDLSLEVWNSPQFGPMTDYFEDWTTAKRFAEYTLPPYNPLGDVAYYMSAQGARQDHLGYVRGEFRMGSLDLTLQPYVHRNRGGGDWHAPSYGSSYSPDPIMFRQSQYRIDRAGVLGSVSADLAGNRLEVGAWYESNEVRLRRPRWRLKNYQAGPEVDFSNVLRLDFDRTGEIATKVVYAQNTNTLMDERLRLTYGFKYVDVGADFRSNGDTPTDGVKAKQAPDANRPSLSLPTKAPFLPQVGAVLKVNDTEEVFGSWTENVNQYPYSPQTGVYNASTSLFGFLEDETDPERSTTVDLGIRTRREGLEGSLTAYYVDYRNRLLGISLCPPTVTCASGLGNVGSVTSKGAEAMLSWPLTSALTWFSSASYNRSTFNDDYLTNPSDPKTVVATRGKDVPDSPRLLFTSALQLSRGALTANAQGRFVDRRYFTYTNDLKTPGDGLGRVPSSTVFDASVGYRFERLGRGTTVQLNVKNVFDERYVSSIGTNGYVAFGDYQTLQTGPRRMFFFTVGFDL